MRIATLSTVAAVLSSLFVISTAFPDPGKWDFTLTQDFSNERLFKSLFSGSKIFVQLTCTAVGSASVPVNILWTLSHSPCWEGVGMRILNDSSLKGNGKTLGNCENDAHIILNGAENDIAPANDASKTKGVVAVPVLGEPNQNPIIVIKHDGMYIFALTMHSEEHDFKATVHVEIISPNGYLSANDWPLLPFYGIMCLIYVAFGIIWLTVSFMQWRDLLRIQFWIGGVIFLGMLEKAMFYAEYQSINNIGESIRGVVLMAEWVSCAKRTLARMLVIIVSQGFGIVKPRLGPMLHRVVGTGALYFALACVESYLRVVHAKNDPSNQIMVASIPLAVLDSAICWWIFTSLLQTTRTLRLRRNTVKLTLYRHFTNTLIFAVIASVIFMLYSIKTRRLNDCFTDWRELWVDDAIWHVLFSLLLLVIMILWRPTNNNQRYAFTPLLDNPEDEDMSEDEEDQFVSDAYGVKMRTGSTSAGVPLIHQGGAPKVGATTSTNDEDDLKWVEENIPAAIADATLPTIDSDEEILNTKFEVSKMQ